MPGVTLTADYGAGGSYVAPALAAALKLPLLDRAISASVAAALQVTAEEATGGEMNKSFLERMLALLAPLSGGVLGAGTDAAPETGAALVDAELFRRQADAVMAEALKSGAVIHGRGGAAAFRSKRDVFRVRLSGPKAARIAQGARLERMSIEQSTNAQREVDRARADYVRRLYGVEVDDPRLYHLQLDSTALALDDCVDLITGAYRNFQRALNRAV